jgi:uncharacterized protein DUF5753
MWRLAKQESGQSRYQGFMDLAAEARTMQQFSVSAVPGLLQTERYAASQLRTGRPESEELLAEQVVARMARQARLTGPKPLNYRVLLDESVIRRPTPDTDVWAEQLERLIEAGDAPNVSLQLVPFEVGLHGLLGGSLTLMWLPSGRTVAYVESSWSGHIIEETDEVEQLWLSYDHLRDTALSSSESLGLLRTVLEDHRHAHPGSDSERRHLAQVVVQQRERR